MSGAAAVSSIGVTSTVSAGASVMMGAPPAAGGVKSDEPEDPDEPDEKSLDGVSELKDVVGGADVVEVVVDGDWLVTTSAAVGAAKSTAKVSPTGLPAVATGPITMSTTLPLWRTERSKLTVVPSADSRPPARPASQSATGRSPQGPPLAPVQAVFGGQARKPAVAAAGCR